MLNDPLTLFWQRVIDFIQLLIFRQQFDTDVQGMTCLTHGLWDGECSILEGEVNMWVKTRKKMKRKKSMLAFRVWESFLTRQ